VSQPQMYALTRCHEKAPSSRDDAPTPDAVGRPAEHAPNPSPRRIPVGRPAERASNPSLREVSQGSRPLE